MFRRIERLQAAATYIPIGEGIAHSRQDVSIQSDALTEHQHLGLLQRLLDALAARHRDLVQAIVSIVRSTSEIVGRMAPAHDATIANRNRP